MSWYENFKTGTKDHLVNAKKYVSSFWYDDYDTSYDVLETYGGFKKQDLDLYKKTNNLYKLASVRRAIANFVQIVTQKNVPVTFATKSDSKTDGKRVILSADVDDKFDVSVGLALHEGSHIILSDFELLSIMNSMYSNYQRVKYEIELTTKREIENGITTPSWTIDKIDKVLAERSSQYPKYYELLNELYLSTGKIGSKGSMNEEMFGIISGLTNWIEDRRIDMYIFKTAPGYRDYYTSMYDHYFNDKIVTKGIASDEYTDETFDSYMFRIINLMNENTDLSKLKGLRAIYRMINLKDISRLKTTKDSFQLAIDILAEILKTVPYENAEMMKGNGNGKGQSGNGDDQNELEITNIEDADINEDDDNMGGANGQMSGQVTAKLGNTDDGDGQEGNTKVKLSDTAKKQLDKKIQKQKDFINGNIKKKNVQKSELDKLKDIQESDTELVRVGNTIDRNGNTMKGVDCIVVKRLTENLIKSNDFPFSNNDWQTGEPKMWAEDEVRRGTMLGTVLGKKLQVRSESRETVFSRLKRGKIDGRMVASLGFDNENVFYTNEVDQFKKANLHISIDYSGSMQGEKLRKSIVSTVAIVKACEMARNINTQVSIRSTDSGGAALPYVVMIHDSRRDSFKQFARYMAILHCSNTTPEGLCFEAIMKNLVPATNDSQSYFLNFSDGQPSYSIHKGSDEIQYSGETAALHTKKQVTKIKDAGIDVLSYFITDYSPERFEHSSDWQIFKKCYGNDAKFVNVENMFEVAKTMNELFLSKDKK